MAAGTSVLRPHFPCLLGQGWVFREVCLSPVLPGASGLGSSAPRAVGTGLALCGTSGLFSLQQRPRLVLSSPRLEGLLCAWQWKQTFRAPCVHLASGPSQFSVLVSDHSPHPVSQPSLTEASPLVAIPTPGLGLQAACKVTGMWFYLHGCFKNSEPVDRIWEILNTNGCVWVSVR